MKLQVRTTQTYTGKLVIIITFQLPTAAEALHISSQEYIKGTVVERSQEIITLDNNKCQITHCLNSCYCFGFLQT